MALSVAHSVAHQTKRCMPMKRFRAPSRAALSFETPQVPGPKCRGPCRWLEPKKGSLQNLADSGDLPLSQLLFIELSQQTVKRLVRTKRSRKCLQFRSVVPLVLSEVLGTLVHQYDFLFVARLRSAALGSTCLCSCSRLSWHSFHCHLWVTTITSSEQRSNCQLGRGLRMIVHACLWLMFH